MEGRASKADDRSPDCVKILSSNQQSNTSLDSVIPLLDDRRKHKHHKSKYNHRRRYTRDINMKSEKSYSNFFHHDNKTVDCTLGSTKPTITQEISVEKDNFKCVWNLNTTVQNPKNIRVKKYICEDRIVPICRRQWCHIRGNRGRNYHRHRQGFCSKSSKESNKQWMANDLISSEFDEISNKSLENYLDVPRSYKYSQKNQKKYVSKLDTLIKRTKERERRLVEKSRKRTQNSPTFSELSSGELATINEYADSLHSRSTLILESEPVQPSNPRYSPSLEYLYPKAEKFSYSPNKDCHNQDFKINIKTEPPMYVGAYSPIGSPVLKIENKQEWFRIFKNEPKDESF